jgi:hypothetical protein
MQNNVFNSFLKSVLKQHVIMKLDGTINTQNMVFEMATTDRRSLGCTTDISKNKYIKSIPCTVSTKTKYDTLIPVMAIVNSVSSFSRFSFRILFRDNDLLLFLFRISAITSRISATTKMTQGMKTLVEI